MCTKDTPNDFESSSDTSFEIGDMIRGRILADALTESRHITLQRFERSSQTIVKVNNFHKSTVAKKLFAASCNIVLCV